MKALKTLMTVFVLGSVLTSGTVQAGYNFSNFKTKTVSTSSKKFELRGSKLPGGNHTLGKAPEKQLKAHNVFFQVFRKNSINQELVEHTRVYGLKAYEGNTRIRDDQINTSGSIRIATKNEHILGGVKVYATYTPKMFQNHICPQTRPLTLLLNPFESIWSTDMQMVDRTGGCRYSAMIPAEQLQDILEFHDRGVLISIGRINNQDEISFQATLSVGGLVPQQERQVEGHTEDFDRILQQHLGQLNQDTLEWLVDDLAPGYMVQVGAGNGYYSY